MDPLLNNIITSCWRVFIVVWLLASIFTKRTVYRESGVQRLGHMIPILLGCYLLFRGYRLPYPFNVQVIPHNDFILVAAAILCVCGVSFCFWARAVLGRNWSGTVTLKEKSRIDRARALPLGPPSDIRRLAGDGPRDTYATRAHRRNHRPYPYLR